jgi:ABC-2 type transport system permease protein
MNKEWAKWWQTMKLSWIEILTYRTNFFLMILAPVIVFYFLKYSLWSSIFAGHAQRLGLPLAEVKINSLTLQGMLNYQGWILIVGLLSQGHSSFKLADDIRLGRISAYLIYPFDFWRFHTAQFLAFQSLQVFISMLALVILVSCHFLQIVSISALVVAMGYCFLVSSFWFCLQFIIGVIAFWLEQTWVLRVLIIILAQFLSGGIIPLSFFPAAWQSFLASTPFPYLNYIPAQILTGEISNAWHAAGNLSLWTLAMVLVAVWLWRKGLKMYTGAGM